MLSLCSSSARRALLLSRASAAHGPRNLALPWWGSPLTLAVHASPRRNPIPMVATYRGPGKLLCGGRGRFRQKMDDGSCRCRPTKPIQNLLVDGVVRRFGCGKWMIAERCLKSDRSCGSIYDQGGERGGSRGTRGVRATRARRALRHLGGAICALGPPKHTHKTPPPQLTTPNPPHHTINQTHHTQTAQHLSHKLTQKRRVHTHKNTANTRTARRLPPPNNNNAHTQRAVRHAIAAVPAPRPSDLLVLEDGRAGC